MIKKCISTIIIICLLFCINVKADSFPIGDVDGDKKVTVKDYILIRKHVLNISTLTGDKFDRADTNNDKKITIMDYISVRKIIINGSSETPTPLPIVHVQEVVLNKTSLVLDVGDTETLSVTINPSNVTDKSVTWSSSDDTIVKVNSKGKITAKSQGTATIIVKSADGGKTSKCSVKVIKTIKHNVMNDTIKLYLDSKSSEIENIYNDNKCDSKRCDIPNDYKSSITTKIKVYKYNITTDKKTYIALTTNNLINYYLIPGNIYYLESESNSSKYEYVKVSGSVRMVNIPNVSNFRDLGGFETNDGNTINYGKLFRGANADKVTSFDSFSALGINKIIDLRNDEELSSVMPKWIPEIKTINSQYSVDAYTVNSTVRNAVSAVMKAIVDGKIVYFHCYGGQDRTGTIAFMLEGLLGVTLGNRYLDYELTYFWKDGSHLKRNSIVKVNKALNDYSPDDEIKFANWFLNKSSDKTKDVELINKFRKKMISGTPKLYSLSSDGKLSLK